MQLNRAPNRNEIPEKQPHANTGRSLSDRYRTAPLTSLTFGEVERDALEGGRLRQRVGRLGVGGGDAEETVLDEEHLHGGVGEGGGVLIEAQVREGDSDDVTRHLGAVRR